MNKPTTDIFTRPATAVRTFNEDEVADANCAFLAAKSKLEEAQAALEAATRRVEYRWANATPTCYYPR